MKNIQTILLIVAFIALNFMYFYFQNKLLEMKVIQNELSIIKSKEQFYNLNFSLNSKMLWTKAPDILCLKQKGNLVSLSQMVKKKPVLVYRFTHKNCAPCNEAEISNIQEIFKDNLEPVNILCSYFSIDDFFTFKRMNRKITNSYHITFEAFELELEKYNSPYYFVLHPDMKISHPYLPNNSYPELSKLYLEGIKRLLAE